MYQASYILNLYGGFHFFLDKCGSVKGGDMLDTVVGLKVQYCREILQNSFNTNETFLRCIILKSERKVVYNISQFVSVSRRNVFYNNLITQTKHVKKNYCID